MLSPVLERLDPEIERLAAHGIYTDVVAVVRSRAEATHTQPYDLDMVEDAVLLYDPDGFFAGVLARLRQRLAELGAQRLRLGRVRYWDLKPDLKPGEDIEL